MARTAAGAALTALQRRQQMALRAQVMLQVKRLYPMWSPANPASWQAFEDAIVLLVRVHSPQSAALAARYYQLFRSVELPKAAARVVPLATMTDEAKLRALFANLVRGRVYKGLASGLAYEQAMASGLVDAMGSAAWFVREAGRNTIVDEARRENVRFARVADGGACAFCAMLASRGPVYYTDEVFKTHVNCNCEIEPSYEGSDWPPNSREYADTWAGANSEPGKATTLNDFRQTLAKQRQ